ncbi:MAG: putative toxin-antitoxin system toxin component, PIN family [Deltaproteobacteria bacterium]|nr:putative toxin-antitoxin system toxin component, PIN family [Deltaproteobacteria bacterium]
MNVVLDTNVLVSGLLTPFGPSGKIVNMVSSGELVLHVDARILSEYREVLHRPKFDFDEERVNTLLDFIDRYALVVSSSTLKNHLPDPDDEPFLEAAVASRASCLITGNAVHYPSEYREGVTVLSPSEFLEFHRNRG